MRSFKIKEKYTNKDIASVLKKEFPRLTNSSLNKAFRLKDVKVNGIRVPKDYIVNLNDEVQIYLNDNILFGIKDKILYAYEDDNILVAYKQKGIVSTLGIDKRNPSLIYFDELVKEEKGNVDICHRLDTNTEGLVIFSKNELAHTALLDGFKNNNIHKEYLTLVYGKPSKDKNILSNYITNDNGYAKVLGKNIPGSKECITEYSTVQYLKKYNASILSVILHTGRTHQIRAHMKYIGCPVIGDSKYGINEINDKFKLYSQVLYAAKYTFTFAESSPLHYLNDITIDFKNSVMDKIYNLLYWYTVKKILLTRLEILTGLINHLIFNM